MSATSVSHRLWRIYSSAYKRTCMLTYIHIHKRLSVNISLQQKVDKNSRAPCQQRKNCNLRVVANKLLTHTCTHTFGWIQANSYLEAYKRAGEFWFRSDAPTQCHSLLLWFCFPTQCASPCVWVFVCSPGDTLSVPNRSRVSAKFPNILVGNHWPTTIRVKQQFHTAIEECAARSNYGYNNYNKRL